MANLYTDLYVSFSNAVWIENINILMFSILKDEVYQQIE